MQDKKSLIKEYYDDCADVYEFKHGVARAGHAHNFARYYEPFLLDMIAPGSVVLELGCGTGVYTKWLLERGCRVTAMDISPRLLARARRRCSEADFVEGDCEDPAQYLSNEQATSGFDVILGVNTFSYYPHKRQALGRYRNLLRPSGRLVLIDMNGKCPLYKIMKMTGKNEMGEWYEEVSESRRGTLDAMVKDAGFKVRRMTHFAFIPNGVGPLVVSLLRPIDSLLHSVPGFRNYSMRVGLVAEGA